MEAKSLFFRHVENVIFEMHEIRTLLGMLQDYKNMFNFNHDVSCTKSSFIKELLIREYESRIGFHQRAQKNLSEVVYDTNGGGSYIEAALSSLGISDENLVNNCAKRIVHDVKENTEPLSWPTPLSDLVIPEKINPLLLQLVKKLHSPRKSNPVVSPDMEAIASALTYLITKNRTKILINSTVTLHGITRSRELVDQYHEFGFGISYNDVLLLRDFWAYQDLNVASICPKELNENEPAEQILDNDDYPNNDTLTSPEQHIVLM